MNPRTLWTLGLVGLLVVLLAAINFVNLMTARAAQRAIEVGVRKSAGARRTDLIAQFLGEACLYVLVAVLLAMAMVELALPAFNAMLSTGDELASGGHRDLPVLARTDASSGLAARGAACWACSLAPIRRS